MALRPTLRATAAGCSAGQRSILRLFGSPQYGPVTTCNSPSRLLFLSSGSSLLRSQVTSTSRLRFYSTERPAGETEGEKDETPSEEFSLEAELEKESERETATPETEKDAETDGEKPWYLEEEPPRHPALVSEAQPLPKMPKGVPAIMNDLVKFVAEDMGLDELNLLDLRTLDPPAALGPSLIMLFGTARSERHLHVSAGNLKSWLRKKGIQAHADGLLGPNEFKIKMRRKQRKAKLLGTSAMPLGGDDGITTRWICMNLGTIRSDSQETIEFETSTGFGIQQTGTTIVVQMLTESKRKELDLETLWSRILARRGVEDLVEDDLEYTESDPQPNEVSMFSEGGSPKVLAVPSQRRFFSTSLRRDNQVIDPPPTSDSTTNHVNTSLGPRPFLNARQAGLEQLQANFAGLSHEDALAALEYSETGGHTPFIRAWNKEIQYLAPDNSWRFRLWLCVAGMKIGVRRFDLAHLRDLVREMELLGIICHQAHYLEMLRAVYLAPGERKVLLEEQSDLALEILGIMDERGDPIVTTEVIVSLIESLAHTEFQGEERGEIQAILEKFLLQADLPYMGDEAVMRLMDAYAAQGNWDCFWETWRMPPKFLKRRSERMYVRLWTLLAESNHQRRCQDGLRWCYNEMLGETPRINIVMEMEVKGAVEACLRVADPSSEDSARRLIVRDAKTEQVAQYEFIQMWRAINPQRPMQ